MNGKSLLKVITLRNKVKECLIEVKYTINFESLLQLNLIKYLANQLKKIP